jgi:hypothetical protein
VFPQQPLLLERVQVNRVESDSAVIVGRVVESSRRTREAIGPDGCARDDEDYSSRSP